MFQPLPTLDWTNSNLKLLPENFHLFDVLRAPLHLKIHHGAPRGICFMWKQSNQREQNVVWAYFLETCRQGSVFSCKCNWHGIAFISYMMKDPVPERMVDVLTLHPRGGADWAGRPGKWVGSGPSLHLVHVHVEEIWLDNCDTWCDSRVLSLCYYTVITFTN